MPLNFVYSIKDWPTVLLQTKRARLKLWEKISLSISLQIIWLIYLSRMVLKHHTNIHIHMFELKITSIQTE